MKSAAARAPEKAVDVADLIGVPYAEGDCWTVARLVLARFGVETPVSQAAALMTMSSLAVELDAGEPLRGGDVLIMDGRRGGDHIGVCLDGRQFIHAVRYGDAPADPVGSRIDRIGHWSGKIRLRLRPRALLEGRP